MNRCGNCKFWGEKLDEKDIYRPCHAVVFADKSFDKPEGPAYVTDASGYYAALRSRADFGCTLFEAKSVTLQITCKKSEDDICPAIFHFPNMGGFEGIDDLHNHWWRKHHLYVQLFSDGLRLTGPAARPYHSQTWMLKK